MNLHDLFTGRKDSHGQKPEEKAKSLEGIIAALEQTIAEKDRAMGLKDKALAEKDEIIASKDQELAEKDEIIASKDQELAEKDEIIASKDQELAEKDEIIASKDQELAEKDRVIAFKDKVLAEKDDAIALSTKKAGEAKAEAERLTAQIDWLRRQVFGDKSTRTSSLDPANGQIAMIFPEKVPENDPAMGNAPAGGSIAGSASEADSPMEAVPDVIFVEEEIQEGKSVRIDSYTRKTGRSRKRKATFEEIVGGLPQNRINIPATEEQRACPECGGKMEHLGWEKVRVEVVVSPARYEANVYYAETLKCMNCSNDEHTVIVETNNVPPAVIPHSLASPSLIANTAIMKYGLYVPNYRLEHYILMLGVRLTRESMANQLIYACEYYLVVIYEWLHQALKERPIINADETTGKVNHCKPLAPLTDSQGNLIDKDEQKAAQSALDKQAREESGDGKLHKKKIYMWMYVSRCGTDKPIVLYDYQPSRAGTCCEAFLGRDYCGYLELDGYSGYNVLEKATHCCCVAHFRSYWFEAIKTKEGKLDKNDPAVTGFLFCNRLFQIERTLAGMEACERQEQRQIQEKPLWEWFWSWQEGIEASGGSPLQKALTYARNHRETLENYMLDGNIPMTNAWAELQARSYATARKNFMFHESAEGARAGAILMSLIETAKANGINPELYLAQLLENRREYLDDPGKRAEFAPWSERMQTACAIKDNK